jgi:hypothetical protein
VCAIRFFFRCAPEDASTVQTEVGKTAHLLFLYDQMTQSIEDIAADKELQQQQHEPLARKRSTSYGSILNIIRCNGHETDVIQPERGRCAERQSSSSSSRIGERRSVSLDSIRAANRSTLATDDYDSGPDSDESSSSTEIKSGDESELATVIAGTFADDSSSNVFDGDDSSARSATDSEVNDAVDGRRSGGSGRTDAAAAHSTSRVTTRRPAASFREAMNNDREGGLAMEPSNGSRDCPTAGRSAAGYETTASSASTTGENAVVCWERRNSQLSVASVGGEDRTDRRGSADLISGASGTTSRNVKRPSGKANAADETITASAVPWEEDTVRSSSSSVVISRGLPVSARHVRKVMMKEAAADTRRHLAAVEVNGSCKPTNVGADEMAAEKGRGEPDDPADHRHQQQQQQQEGLQHQLEDDFDTDGLYPGWPQNYVYQLARAFSYRAKKSSGPARKPLQHVFGGGAPSLGSRADNRPATTVFDAEIKLPVPEEVGEDIDEGKSGVELAGESIDRNRLASTADEKQSDVVCGLSVREAVRLLNMQASKSFEPPLSRNLADASTAVVQTEPSEAESVSHSVASPMPESASCVRLTTARSTSIGRHTRTSAAALIQERMKVFEKTDST